MRILSTLLFTIVISLVTNMAFAQNPIVLPAWQTEAVFEQPESIVYHAESKLLYVSNINGDGMEENGKGYISTMSLEGQIIDQYWLTDLDAPKGLTIVDNTLYIADIKQLIAVDITSKEIIARYSAPKAKFLNDVVADNNGNVYVSAFLTNTLYRLADNSFSVWIENESLEFPNGLLFEDQQLIVASWGIMTDGFATKIPGHIKTININTKQINSLGDHSPIGNLDGLESDGNGGYFVTDWMSGKLLHITKKGQSTTVIDLEQGSADHTIIPEQNLIIIPMMLTNKLIAFKIK